MKLALELLGNLVLTFLGFVLPVVGLLLPVFQQGFSLLTEQYENKKQQAEENIKTQIKKLGKNGANKDLDTNELQNNLDKLEKIKEEADKKLSLLVPKKQVIRFFVPLVLAFSFIELACFIVNKKIVLHHLLPSLDKLLFSASIFLFIYTLYILWSLLDIIIEAKGAIDEFKSKEERENRQALVSIMKKTKKGMSYFLEKIYIKAENKKVNQGKPVVTLTAQEKRELEISIKNAERRMAKNLEIGFIFPLDFMIEKKSSYSIYSGKHSQIVRYKTDFLHGDTNLILKPLTITPLKTGTYKIKTFINAENIETIDRKFTFKVV